MAENKAKTIDGSRTRIDDLNLEPPQLLTAQAKGWRARLGAAYRNLSRVMAGMYTGLTCYGTPNERHGYDDKDRPGPDKRPL